MRMSFGSHLTSVTDQGYSKLVEFYVEEIFEVGQHGFYSFQGAGSAAFQVVLMFVHDKHQINIGSGLRYRRFSRLARNSVAML